MKIASGKSLIICVLIVLLVTVLAQKKRRNRNKGSDQCHLKEALKCLDPLLALGHEKDPTILLTSSQGIDTVCKTIKDDAMKCITSFLKKCSTPLHRELGNFILDFPMDMVNKLCDGERRAKFLKHASCLHSASVSKEFKTNCNNRSLNVFGKIDMENFHMDNAYEAVCCNFNSWFACSGSIIKRECNSDGFQIFDEFNQDTIEPYIHLFCPKDIFGAELSLCKKIMEDTKLKSGEKPPENILTKLMLQYVPFLFINY